MYLGGILLVVTGGKIESVFKTCQYSHHLVHFAVPVPSRACVRHTHLKRDMIKICIRYIAPGSHHPPLFVKNGYNCQKSFAVQPLDL